jgi:squalene-hopene/tetraprenyl-beta-curcumene cyclase
MSMPGKVMGLISVAMVVILLGLPPGAAQTTGKNAPSPQEIQAVLSRGVDYFKSVQNADGSFAPKLAGPGVTALVVAGLLRNGVSSKEPVVVRGLEYLEKQVRADGGIYSKFLANYTTSVAVMAFQEANRGGKYDAILKNAGRFLQGLQLDERKIGVADRNFGGFGYDRKGSPDMSNTAFAVEALIKAGVPKDDPAIKKALHFIGRCQNLPGEFNDQPFAKKVAEEDKGGFVYRPDPDDKRHKTPAGGLRSLGAMTYGGLKSFLYAGVDKDDPRVKAALAWVRRHYTLEENTGQGQSGLYYYYHTFGKAMAALGDDLFEDAAGVKHPWRRELFEALKRRQQANGSWRNQADRTFGEATPELATAFAILSLSYCAK